MKTKKIFKVLMLMGLISFASTLNTSAVEPKEVCVDYEISCDRGTFNGTICGSTTKEIVEKVWAISEIIC